MTFRVVTAASLIDSLDAEWQRFASVTNNLIPARIVLDGDTMVAIGSIWRNPLHPRPLRFEYKIGSTEDASALSLLLNGLTGDLVLRPDDLLHISVGEHESEVLEWALSSGFHPVMTTWSGLLLPNQVDAPSLDQIHRLSDHDDPGLRTTLVMLHEQIYRTSHYWNPPGSLLTERASSLFMGDDLIPEHLWYAVNEDGDPIGISSLRHCDLEDRYELGWVGVLPEIDETTHRQLLDAALSAAGGSSIEIEVDANEVQTLARLSELEVIWGHTTYRLERPAPFIG